MTLVKHTVEMMSKPSKVDILILGAGWTSDFLIPLLKKENIDYAATTTTGRDGTYKFKFEPAPTDVQIDAFDKSWSMEDQKQYAALPQAKTVLITFPLKGKGQSTHLCQSYGLTHDREKNAQFIQLGSTGIFQIEGQELWVTRHSRYDKQNPRAIAENELMHAFGGCVLDLAGLWGGERQPRKWIDRVAKTKEQLKEKKSLHMIHGLDVARGILAVHQNFSKALGERFMLTDLLVYDWYELILGFGAENDAESGDEKRLNEQIRWVGELMEEQNVRALPRSREELGRCYDTREFWTTFELMPARARI